MDRVELSGLRICAIFLFAITHSAIADDISAKLEYQTQIEKLRSNEKVQIALNYVETIVARSQKDLIELTEIPAPPFQEQQRATRFAELLKEAGLTEVTVDEVGNVIGRRPGANSERVIAYSAHLDTVFPAGTDVTVKYKDKKMYAPGIGDNTSGLVQVLGVLRGLQHAEISTKAEVLFIGNVGEEGLGDLRGVKHLFRDDAKKIDTLIAVDGGPAERIVFGGIGSHRYRVIFRGPGGHSWGAFGLANPHHALGRAIEKFVKVAPSVTSTGEKTSYNIGRIGGGTSINSIPFESWMEVDIRSGDQSKLDEIDTAFRASVDQALLEENDARLRGPEVTVRVERVGTRPAAKGNPELAVVQRAMAAVQSFSLSPELRLSSTDANLPLSLGIPAITMSRGGRGGNAHSPDEWWQNIDAHVAIQIGILTLIAEAGLAD